MEVRSIEAVQGRNYVTNYLANI